MTFGIQSTESLREGLRREIHDQIQRALAALSQAADIGRAAHRFRRTLKRARALLKHTRPSLTAEAYRSGNRRMRDAARLVAPVRDAGVLVEAARALIERSPDAEVGPSLGPLLTELEAERDARFDAATLQVGPFTRARDLLESASIDWTEEVPVEAGELLSRGIATSYEAVRARAALAFDESPDPEAHHELRKRAKQLRHQLEFLSPACPEALVPVAEGFHCLTDLLGDANDLVVLGSWVESARARQGPDRTGLLAELHEGRTALWAEAASVGEGLLAEETGDFVSRIVECWALARPQG